MNILVTGASGFLGSSLCRRLIEDGHTVTKINSTNCDLTKDDSLYSFEHTTYEQIFHLAAWTQAGDFCLYHPGEQWLINQKINTNVLNWWSDQQPNAKLICMGTSCAYAPDEKLVEENYLVGTPIDSLFTYAMTKRMLYIGLLALHKQYNLNYINIVPSTIYGTGYHTDGRQMHFIFDLIRKILRGKHYNEPVVLWGDGYQKRELVLLDDFINLMLEITRAQKNMTINVGAGREHTIREFAEIICDIVGYSPDDIDYDTSKYVGSKSKILDTSKLNSLINYQQTPLYDGLKSTIEWFKPILIK